MIIDNSEQGTPEWFKSKLGIASASNAKRLVTPAKLQATAAGTIETYAIELAAEILKGSPSEEITGVYAMERGKELEPIARRQFALDHDVDVEEVGFCTDSLGRYGCSPDGLIIVDNEVRGGLEIKCPLEKEFVEIALSIKTTRLPPRDYLPQCWQSMMVADLAGWNFMAYHPDFEPVYAVVPRNDDVIKIMGEQITKLNKRRDEIVKIIKGEPLEAAA